MERNIESPPNKPHLRLVEKETAPSIDASSGNQDSVPEEKPVSIRLRPILWYGYLFAAAVGFAGAILDHLKDPSFLESHIDELILAFAAFFFWRLFLEAPPKPLTREEWERDIPEDYEDTGEEEGID
jgi:hypothetical protein